MPELYSVNNSPLNYIYKKEFAYKVKQKMTDRLKPLLSPKGMFNSNRFAFSRAVSTEISQHSITESIDPSRMLKLDQISIQHMNGSLSEADRFGSSNNISNAGDEYKKSYIEAEKVIQQLKNIKIDTEKSLRRNLDTTSSDYKFQTRPESRLNVEIDDIDNDFLSPQPRRDTELSDRISIKELVASEINKYMTRETNFKTEPTSRTLQILSPNFDKRSPTYNKENRFFTERSETKSQDGKIVAYIAQIQDLEYKLSTLTVENEQLNKKLKKEKSGSENVNQVKDDTKVQEQQAAIHILQQKLERVETSNRKLLESLAESESVLKKILESEKIGSQMKDELNIWKIRYENLKVHNEEDLRRSRTELEKALRVQLEEEYKNRGQKFEKERVEYEKTIRSFKEKFNEFERKLYLLSQENCKLKGQTSGRGQDKLSLQKKDNQENESQIEELKKQLLQSQEYAETEKKNLTKRAQEAETKIAMQAVEISKFVNEIYKKENENEQLKNKCFELEKKSQENIEKALVKIEIQMKEKLEKEKQEYYSSVIRGQQNANHQIIFYMEKIKENETEISRLVELNLKLTSQLEEMSKETINLKSKIDNLTKDQQIQELKAKLEQENKLLIENEVRATEMRFKESLKSNEDQIKHLTLKVEDYEMRQVLYFIEIERLYAINSDLIDQVNKVSSEAQSLIEENTILKQRLMKKDEGEFNMTFKDERIKFDATIQGLALQIEDYEKRIQSLMDENTRLSDLSIARLQEINELKNTFTTQMEIESKSTKHKDIIRKSNNELRDMAFKFETEKNNMETQIKQLKHVIDLNRQEITRLQDLNQHIKNENDELHIELEKLGEGSSLIMKLQTELRFKNQQYEQCLREVEELRRNRDFFKQQLELTSARGKENSERCKDPAQVFSSKFINLQQVQQGGSQTMRNKKYESERKFAGKSDDYGYFYTSN